jgi:tryptophanyl-tRNA synthetase
MERVVSGIRPTGPLHIGNYFGAVQNFVKMQEQFDCYYFVADYHSLTTHPQPGHLQQNVRQLIIEMIACGVDPDKVTFYVQSDIPQIPELYLIFNMLAYKGELERVVTFKEKAKKQANNINAGLLTYPVLMSVDIIIQKADKVPVGKDQEQHLEITRNFVNRFNYMYKTDFFPEPVAFNFGKELIKIPGLDGTGKMGKSEGGKNAIYFVDDPKVIIKKVKRAVTDSGPEKANSVKSEPVQNLFDILKVVSKPEIIEHFENTYNDCSIRYGDLKQQLAEDLVTFTEPYREKIRELTAQPEKIEEIRRAGAEKARKTAEETLNGVKSIIGLSAK